MSAATVFSGRLRAARRPALRAVLLILGGTALIALSAQLKVPMWPVPMTMQTFAVLLIGLTYGPRLAAATVATYLLAGVAGFPVFTTGPASLIGPTGGYLIGFLPAAALAGTLARQGLSRPALGVFAAMLSGSLVIYICGAAWLATFVGLKKAIALGVVPFLIGDTLKAALAAALVPTIWSLTDGRRPHL